MRKISEGIPLISESLKRDSGMKKGGRSTCRPPSCHHLCRPVLEDLCEQAFCQLPHPLICDAAEFAIFGSIYDVLAEVASEIARVPAA